MIVGVCRLIANHLHLAFFESIPEVRVLPSTGITRLQRSYYPVRLPPMPPPEATFPVGVPSGASVGCSERESGLRHYPAGRDRPGRNLLVVILPTAEPEQAGDCLRAGA
jgi:hypothetical protein